MQLFHKKPTQVTSLKFPKRFQRIDALANKLKKFPKLFFWVWWQPLDASRRIGKKESILARSYLKPLAMLATKQIKIQTQASAASTSFRKEVKRHQKLK